MKMKSFPAVAYNTHPSYDEFLIVWENQVTQPSITQNIEALRVAGTAGGGDFGGEIIGSRIPIAVSSNSSYEPDVTYNLSMNEYMAVYTTPIRALMCMVGASQLVEFFWRRPPSILLGTISTTQQWQHTV